MRRGLGWRARPLAPREAADTTGAVVHSPRRSGRSLRSARGSGRLRSFGCDHVGDLRRTLQLKTLHLRLQHLVRIGDPLVLAQMFEPTIDQKRFDEACWVGRVL